MYLRQGIVTACIMLCKHSASRLHGNPLISCLRCFANDTDDACVCCMCGACVVQHHHLHADFNECFQCTEHKEKILTFHICFHRCFTLKLGTRHTTKDCTYVETIGSLFMQVKQD